MNTDTDMWVSFARTFGMLFIVLALLVLVFYLLRKFSGLGGKSGADAMIQVAAVHHLSPKEKLVVVNVGGQAILVGISPAGMSKLADLEHCPAPAPAGDGDVSRFSSTLSRMLNKQKRADASPGKEKSNG